MCTLGTTMWQSRVEIWMLFNHMFWSIAEFKVLYCPISNKGLIHAVKMLECIHKVLPLMELQWYNISNVVMDHSMWWNLIFSWGVVHLLLWPCWPLTFDPSPDDGRQGAASEAGVLPLLRYSPGHCPEVQDIPLTHGWYWKKGLCYVSRKGTIISLGQQWLT